MKTIEELINDVGGWSFANFGRQETKGLEVIFNFPVTTPNNPPIPCLGGLAPMLGIVEESGEFFEAIQGRDLSPVRDAVGDMGVYLCDFIWRESLNPPREYTVEQNLSGVAGLSVAVGRFCHAKLKRLQGIRGFDDEAKYRDAMQKAVDLFWRSLDQVSKRYGSQCALDAVNHTFETVVAKRNWKATPSDGGGATHENAGDVPGQMVAMPIPIEKPEWSTGSLGDVMTNAGVDLHFGERPATVSNAREELQTALNGVDETA